MRFSLKKLLLLVPATSVPLTLIVLHGVLGVLYTWVLCCISLVILAMSTRRARHIIIAIAVACVGVLIWPIVIMSAHPVSMTKLALVTKGMPKKEIQQLLGHPTKNDNGKWTYSGMMWCHVRIVFSNAGLVVEIDHDH